MTELLVVSAIAAVFMLIGVLPDVADELEMEEMGYEI